MKLVKIIPMASAPLAGVTLRTRVGKRSSSHLDKVSFSEIIPEERNAGTGRCKVRALENV